MTRIALAVWLCVCCPTGLAVAAEVDSAALPSSHTTGTEFATVVRMVGTRAHKHFIIDSRLPTYVDLQGLDPRELSYPQLLSILDATGFVAFEQNGLTFVLPNTGARQLPMKVIPPEDLPAVDGELVTTILPVKTLSAAQLVPVLRPLMPPWSQLSVALGTNALIICDRAGNVRRIVQLVKTLEKLPRVDPDQFKTRAGSCSDEQRRDGACP